ncbi:hypothetical protein M011DRAFT_484691 [Sporormia fimetaria CBS 119925]|uniref:Uncharacterized protein n=1 Tax=Sporormia fimetaria CBS 119925 TaxID=1340428 RepID=A0A6A6VKF7_9PLEO|nr:hypothetical protein M011DRAFT_484691 [Sporormia fimetaria CBS 119925]
MHRHTRSDAGELPSPRSSRAPSFSSDRPSISGSITFQMPTTARPPPAYIAASVASQIVTDHHNAQLHDDGSPLAGAQDLTNAVFSGQALSLLNSFLDHLLFAFLSTARSPSLAAIRPAITEILKPRLAREATTTADDELQGLIGGDDEDEFPEHIQYAGAIRWDVEKVWKRTRLRIMVYTRLGELEDQDEQRYVDQERGLSMDQDEDDEANLVSWASAIFLTSVIEYIAEQTLLVSGQASYARMSAKLRRQAQASARGELQLERIIVEDYDVEKIALNSALGRLWRTWRRRSRSSISLLSPTRTPRSVASLSSLHSRHLSYDTSESVPEVPEHLPTETEIASNIPLPMRDNDVEEIEVPGIARSVDSESESGAPTPVPRLKPQRPTSVITLGSAEALRKKMGKERPVSLPAATPQPFTVPTRDDDTTDNEDFATPLEGSAIADDRVRQEHAPQYDAHRHSVPAEEDPDMVAFSASTGLGFYMGPSSPTKQDGLGPEDEDASETPTNTAYTEPQVLPVKRLSIEKPGTPGVVRTVSTRSQHTSTRSSTEPRSYLDDAHTDDELSGSEAIGVARTSNVPVVPPPSPPAATGVKNEPAQDSTKQMAPDHQGYVELAPRQVTTSSSTGVIQDGPTRETRLPRSQPQFRRPDVRETDGQRREKTPPKGRGQPLAALREAETWTHERHEGPDSSIGYERSPNGRAEPHRSARVPEAQGSVVDRRPIYDGRPMRMVGSAHEDTTPKRASSSSTTRSTSTSILNVGRDSEAGSRPRGLSGRMSEEDRQREFDSLVQSKDTVKLSLTPKSMRDMDEFPTTKTIDTSRPTTSSVKVYPRVNADRDNQFGSQPLPPKNSARTNGHPSSGSTPVRTNMNQKPRARGPIDKPESMADFADFIRSTGPPPGIQRVPQPFLPLSRGPRSPSASNTTVSVVRKASMKSLPARTISPAAHSPSSKSRIHMEPRSPAGQRSGNDDLIDFIRQGPPGQNDGQPRIPRSVAPFRTTVDSDQFDRMLDETATVDYGSVYGSQVSTTSKQSANSRTGLLAASSTAQPAYSNSPQKLNQQARHSPSGPSNGYMSTAEPQIQRTRRRVKDPYAIDTDDEEDEDDDLLTALPSSRQRNNERRQEESLMDFLNSTDPPPSTNTPQPFLLNDAAIAAAKARSAPPVRKPVASPAAREPQTARTATSDLADFLRSSGPPEPVNAPVKKEQRARGVAGAARFWRKKAVGDA